MQEVCEKFTKAQTEQEIAGTLERNDDEGDENGEKDDDASEPPSSSEVM